uniref:Pentatricopeptide repeat-containing protein At2g27800, mitochondrial n=1 Tax=Anthurium amnicola TaxID=1678845 RepID=A0A1D1ZLV5_9ARAE
MMVIRVLLAGRIHTYLRLPPAWTDTRTKTLTPLLLHCSPLDPSRHHSTSNPPRHRRSRPRRIPPTPPPDPSRLQAFIDQLPPRFTAEDLRRQLDLQRDPALCLHLFHWASHQPRFRHDGSTYLVAIKKLGAARMYQEMDAVAAQALAADSALSEPLFNTAIYFYTEARMLSKAVNAYKRMRDSPAAALCRPTLRTYNLLFAALLGKGTNSYINHMYMDTIRCLFRQMTDAGIEPDVFSLNAVIKGYVLSLHLNDALRVFHQMGVVYRCLPDQYSYSYLVHGLCAQGRTNNAKQLHGEMKGKGFFPSEKAYNSLVCALAMAGEVEEAVAILWEMGERRMSADLITYRTVLDEMCRQGSVRDAMVLLGDLQERGLVDGRTHRKLLYGIQDNYGTETGDLVPRSRFREASRCES